MNVNGKNPLQFSFDKNTYCASLAVGVHRSTYTSNKTAGRYSWENLCFDYLNITALLSTLVSL